MKPILFSYADSCLITRNEILGVEKDLRQEIARVTNALGDTYETEYASINLPCDNNLIAQIKALVKEKRTLHPTIMVVIGIGGSNLGTKAVHEAVSGTLYNEKNPQIRVYFVDTVDAEYISEVIECVEAEIHRGHNIIVNVISKSGTTTETIANFELFLGVLKTHRPYNYSQFVVVTTDEGSVLWKFAQEYKMVCIALPKFVGGRYSVFSAVGLFPLCFLSVDIDALHEGARAITESCISIDILNNPAALSATLIALHYKKGIAIHDTFLFSVEFESFGKWYRQLMGESIGKAYNRNGELVHIGITPTVSVGSVDLHSVVQLYLGGPYDKYTTFISVEKNKVDLVVESLKEWAELGTEIQNKSLSTIMDAILQGTKTAYMHDKRPFVSISVPEKTEFYMGQLLQMKMLEMIYLGYLLGVNPFDQPQVELYKKETKQILDRD